RDLVCGAAENAEDTRRCRRRAVLRAAVRRPSRLARAAAGPRDQLGRARGDRRRRVRGGRAREARRGRPARPQLAALLIRGGRRERIRRPQLGGGTVADYSAHENDRRLLHALGYAQELRRGMSGFSNFAISFTIISILSGTLTLYAPGLSYGGPVMEAYGWPIVSVFVIIVALGMAEIASKYPTAGGLYYWASKMGGPVWGWFTGWFNLIGQIAITAGIDYGGAIFADALLQLLWPGTFKGSSHEVIYVYAVILALHALMNIFSVQLVALLNDVSVWWHCLGVLIIVGFLVFKPDHHQSFGTVFGKTINNSGFSHSWLWFVLLLGLLQAQYTYTGYDASAHMSEETQDASRGAARGVIMSIIVSAVFGYILALGVTFAIQDFKSTGAAGTFAVKQIFIDSLGTTTAKVM